ncbi:porin [Sphingomonas sp.]|uniref:porin n=1 Tax=Sphingomonas sp. TaxID=28214 RepID=UPI002FCB6ECB
MVGGTALIALSLVLAPAFAASLQPKAKKKPSTPTLAVGGFTPAVADPRLAALFANRGLSGGSFHFTPSATPNGSKAVKVAVRARAATTAAAAMRGGSESAAVAGLTPTAYNLGVAVGWKQFALSGDVAKVDSGLLPGGREAAEVGLSYAGKKFTGRLQVGAERSDGRQLRILPQESSYSVDLGGSYTIARNVDLTGGVRYRIQHDRLERLDDQRRDSQAVYIGTAFRF